MTEPVLWPLDDHTRAKHRVLRAYLQGWFAVMAEQARKVPHFAGRPRLLAVDGFAGPGRYEGGEEGSPLIMLRALLDHDRFEKWGEIDFLYLFIEHDSRRVEHLEAELAEIEVPANVQISVVNGE